MKGNSVEWIFVFSVYFVEFYVGVMNIFFLIYLCNNLYVDYCYYDLGNDYESWLWMCCDF